MAITAWPSYDPANPFYTPNFTYGNPMGHSGWVDDPLNVGYQIGEQNNEAAWTKRLAELGYGGLSTKDTFMRSMYGRAQEGYGAAQMQNAGLTWQDYLKTLNLDRLWSDASPAARGDQSAQYTPEVRWQRRA